jgi:serine/threonine-protein kinase RsbW
MELSLSLPLQPESASVARHSLDGLAERLGEELLDDLRLLVTELVTNAIRHAQPSDEPWLRLNLAVNNGSIRVDVIDHGPGFLPIADEPGFDETSGRGLYLVEQLADRWGVGVDGNTRVWFEIDRSRASSRA